MRLIWALCAVAACAVILTATQTNPVFVVLFALLMMVVTWL